MSKKRFIRRSLLLIVVFALVLLLLPSTIFAAPTEVYVSENGNNSGTGSVGSPFATIEHAISVVSAGGTVYVKPGTYNEAVKIEKVALTLQSTDGRDATIINNPDVSSETVGVSVGSGLGLVKVEGFTVENFRNGIIQGMGSATGTTLYVYNNKIIPENLDPDGYVPYLRNGIQVTGDGSRVVGNYIVGAPLTVDWASSGIGVVNAKNILVQGNTVNTGAADIGISVLNYDAEVDSVTIEENIVNGSGNGIRLSGQFSTNTNIVKNITIKNNNLNQCNRGINAQILALENVTITGNEIHNNTVGVRFSNTATLSGNILINNNSITGNEEYGVINSSTVDIDATNNWWGSNTGPTHETNPGGTGDSVSANVLFDPWTVITAPAPPSVPTPVGSAIEVLGVSSYEANSIGASTFFYNRILGREPDPEGLNHWADAVDAGIITGSTMLQSFIFCEENSARISGYTDTQFIEYLYSAIFDRGPDAEGLSGWLALLAGGASREDIVRGFAGSQEFKDLCASLGIRP